MSSAQYKDLAIQVIMDARSAPLNQRLDELKALYTSTSKTSSEYQSLMSAVISGR